MDSEKMRLRWHVRDGHTMTASDGSVIRVRSFGVRVGYWPCLRGPYLELSVNTRRLDIWFGLASYRWPDARTRSRLRTAALERLR